MQRSLTESHRRNWLGILLSALSLGAVLLLIHPSDIVTALGSADYRYLLISVGGILLFLLLRAYRWRYLLELDGTVGPVFHIQNVGYMLSNLLPLRIGDVARAVMIGNLPSISFAQGLSTLVVERLLDMLFFVTLLPLTLSAVDRLPDWMRAAAYLSGSAAAGGVIVLITVANRRTTALHIVSTVTAWLPVGSKEVWATRSEEMLDGLSCLTHRWGALKLAVYTFVLWLPVVVAYAAVLRAVNLDITLPAVGFVLCAAALSVAAPSSPGQVGVFHAGVIAALRILGQPQSEAAAFAFLYHAINVLLMVMMGSIGLARTEATLKQVVTSTRRHFRRPQ